MNRITGRLGLPPFHDYPPSADPAPLPDASVTGYYEVHRPTHYGTSYPPAYDPTATRRRGRPAFHPPTTYDPFAPVPTVWHPSVPPEVRKRIEDEYRKHMELSPEAQRRAMDEKVRRIAGGGPGLVSAPDQRPQYPQSPSRPTVPPQSPYPQQTNVSAPAGTSQSWGAAGPSSERGSSSSWLKAAPSGSTAPVDPTDPHAGYAGYEDDGGYDPMYAEYDFGPPGGDEYGYDHGGYDFGYYAPPPVQPLAWDDPRTDAVHCLLRSLVQARDALGAVLNGGY